MELVRHSPRRSPDRLLRPVLELVAEDLFEFLHLRPDNELRVRLGSRPARVQHPAPRTCAIIALAGWMSHRGRTGDHIRARLDTAPSVRREEGEFRLTAAAHPAGARREVLHRDGFPAGSGVADPPVERLVAGDDDAGREDLVRAAPRRRAHRGAAGRVGNQGLHGPGESDRVAGGY